MRNLVFIDDDPTELVAFEKIVREDYHCKTVEWPGEESKLLEGPVPDIFVSDLYLPGPDGNKDPAADERRGAKKAATEVGERFRQLFANQSLDDKERLQETMKTIDAAYDALKLQWTAMGQSPDYGVELFARVKERYPNVPFVFYSRKITPEDVIHVLQEGAVDAIRKGALGKHEVLARLVRAQEIFHGSEAQRTRNQGLNANVTLIR